MAISQPTETSREVFKATIQQLALLLKVKGFTKQGNNFWKLQPDGSAFAGVVIGSRTWPGSKRVSFSIGMHGGHAKFHLLNPVRKTDEFIPHYENTQFSTDISAPKGDGRITKEWVIFPSTIASEIVSDIWARIEADAIPVIDTLLNESRLRAAVERHEIGTEMPIYRRQLLGMTI